MSLEKKKPKMVPGPRLCLWLVVLREKSRLRTSDADPAFFEQALRLNFEIPHGSIAIHDEGGRPRFMVHDTYPRATVDAEEIRSSVLEVAARADAIEHLLTGFDLH